MVGGSSEISKGFIKVYNHGSKSVYNGCVTVSIPYKCNELVLRATRGNSELYSVDLLHESAVFSAMCASVHHKMAGRIQDAIKNKFLELKAHAAGNDCTISVTCAANKTAVKRVAKLMVTAMHPAKLYPLYSQAVKRIGEPPSRECFAHCADKLHKAIKSSLHILVTGKVFLSHEELQYIAEKVGEEVANYSAVEGDKKAVPIRATAASYDLPTAKAPHGLLGLLVKDYIKSQLRVPVHYSADKFYVETTPGKLEKLNDKEKIDKYASKVHDAMKRHYHGFIFYAAKKAYGPVSVLHGDSAKEVSKAAIESAIKASLK